MANGVVMGFPADRFEPPPPRYEEEPTFVPATPDPELFPCSNSGQKLHPLYNSDSAPIIQMESITSSNIASSNNTTISANWHLTFSLKNPNKFASIHYKKIQVSVFNEDKRLSYGDVDYFYQGKREEGRMNVEISGLVVKLEKQKMNDASEMVLIYVILDAVVLLESKFTKIRWQVLEANCGDVKVRPPMSLKLDGSRRCNVNLQ
ncbi:hypothetical protein DITRI_Ditri01bG0046900 [Diplodiscus trichospermus]